MMLCENKPNGDALLHTNIQEGDRLKLYGEAGPVKGPRVAIAWHMGTDFYTCPVIERKRRTLDLMKAIAKAADEGILAVEQEFYASAKRPAGGKQ